MEKTPANRAEKTARSETVRADTSRADINRAAKPAYVNGFNGPATINIKTLMDAGAHFGHQAHRWNPKMLPFIFGERNGIHIINLDATMKAWTRARECFVNTMSRGGTVLFVGTKPQARDIVKGEAERCNAFHVTNRWLGGMLSNFQTIKNSVERMKKLEELLAKAEANPLDVRLTKKERLTIGRELFKLEASLGGIRSMRRPPDLIFVVDVIKEQIAVSEANRLRIPIVALVDTNSSPNNIDYAVPSNDDAARTIQLFVAAAADAVLQGRTEFEARRQKDGRDSNGEREGRGGKGSGDKDKAAAVEKGATAASTPSAAPVM